MAGRVVHVHDNVPDAVYIGRSTPYQRLRASMFANPHKIGRDGSRLQVIANYDQDLYHLVNGDLRDPHRSAEEWAEALIALREKPLACWCRHDGEPRTGDNACHGDVILDLLDCFTDDDIRSMAHQP